MNQCPNVGFGENQVSTKKVAGDCWDSVRLATTGDGVGGRSGNARWCLGFSIDDRLWRRIIFLDAIVLVLRRDIVAGASLGRSRLIQRLLGRACPLHAHFPRRRVSLIERASINWNRRDATPIADTYKPAGFLSQIWLTSHSHSTRLSLSIKEKQSNSSVQFFTSLGDVF